jgi:hypothetical protein
MRFSPDGRSILFQDYYLVGEQWIDAIDRMSSFGRGRTVLQTGSADVTLSFAQWSSTGGVWFSRSVTNDTRLVGPAGPVTWMYAASDQGCTCPKEFAVEPGAERVAFIRADRRVDPVTLDRARSHELWMSNADGTGEVKLTSFGDMFQGSEGAPQVRWSANGYIYFTALVGSGDALVETWHRIRPDGTDLVRIATDLRVEHLEPSPDGRHLLLTTSTGRVYLTNAAGRNRLIVPGTDAVFSPDNRRIAFQVYLRVPGSSFRRQGDIYTMPLTGLSKVRVTRTTTLSERPLDWQRAPS